MNHLIVLYYLLSFTLSAVAISILMVVWYKSKDPKIARIMVFLSLMAFHTVLAAVNYYLSEIVGTGFDQPFIQYVYTFLLYIFFAVFLVRIPAFAHELVDRPWKGWVRIVFLVISGLGFFFPLLPLFQGVASEAYLGTLWRLLYHGYINFIWVAVLYFLVYVSLHQSKIVNKEQRDYALWFLVFLLIFLPGLVADQLWELLQVTWGWIPRGFTFEPLLLLVLLGRSLSYSIKSLRPKKGEDELPSDSDERLKTLGLSAREREVLVLASQGKTNLEIGEQLFISEGTVKNHIHNILEKTGYRSRWELAKLL